MENKEKSAGAAILDNPSLNEEVTETVIDQPITTSPTTVAPTVEEDPNEKRPKLYVMKSREHTGEFVYDEDNFFDNIASYASKHGCHPNQLGLTLEPPTPPFVATVVSPPRLAKFEKSGDKVVNFNVSHMHGTPEHMERRYVELVFPEDHPLFSIAKSVSRGSKIRVEGFVQTITSVKDGVNYTNYRCYPRAVTFGDLSEPVEPAEQSQPADRAAVGDGNSEEVPVNKTENTTV